MTRTLAFRRHQSQIKKSKVSHWDSTKWGLVYSSIDPSINSLNDPVHSTPRSIGIVATTPAFTRRIDRWQEKSRQELRADAMLDYEI